jgi:O-methyltransferase
MKQCLTRALVLGEGWTPGRRRRMVALLMELLAARGLTIVSEVPEDDRAPGLPAGRVPSPLGRMLKRRGLRAVRDDRGRPKVLRERRGASGRGLLDRVRQFDTRLAMRERELGLDWPRDAETMIGLRRLENVEECLSRVIEDGVPGDVIEAGAWRGGTAIFMRAVLAAYGETDRTVWVADSFQGLPKPDPIRHPADRALDYTVHPELSVGVEQVRHNFARYGLLDDQVEFLVGWFKDTLPSAPIDELALLRLDADLYESTLDALTCLYPKLSPGGYCIVDDYGLLEACRRAVHDYRKDHSITDAIRAVDWTGVYWRRES